MSMPNFSDVAVAIGGVGAAVSALLSLCQLWMTRRHRQAELLAEIGLRHLERAWNALTVNGTQVSPPPADRRRWLAAARHIVEYRNAFDLLRDNAVRKRCQAEEAYWRHQFYEALDPLAMDFGYYPDWSNFFNLTGRDLEKASTIIVHRFADWPEGKADAIDTAVQRYAEMTDPSRLSHRWVGLRRRLGLLGDDQR